MSSIYNEAPYVDPLVPDANNPLDDKGQYLARDYVPEITINDPYDRVDGTTLAKPVTLGVWKRGITPLNEYSGLPNFGGRIDLVSGVVTEYNTSNVFSYREWNLYKFHTYRQRLLELNEARDLKSDITNLPGIKPYFEDDWFIPKLLKPTRPSRPDF